MTQPKPLDLAEAGYHAYGEWVAWKNFAGDPMPTWEQLPETQRQAWVAAAGAIYHTVVNPDGPRLTFTPESWAAFLAGVKTGELATDG